MNILLVDDEADVVQSLLPLLKAERSFKVNAATTGEEALAHASRLGIVDVLISDVWMTPMSGFQLRDQLQERFPQLKTIFITGYNLDDYARQIQDCPVLQKPFAYEMLLEKLYEVIAAPKRDLQLEEMAEASAPPAQPPEAEDLSGTTLAGYQILSKIGRGNLGPVYKALQAGIDRPVALKMLARDLENHPRARMKFLLDARAKANLQDPHFLAVYEAGNVRAEQKHCFYAREFVDGETLSDLRARNEYLSPVTAARIIRHVATALAHLSRSKCHHKLVSARSIFVTPDQSVRLTNLAIHEGVLTDPHKEIIGVGKLLLPLLEPSKGSELNELVTRMTQSNSQGFLSFAALLQALDQVERHLKLSGPSKISADHAAAIRMMETIKKLKRCGSALAAIGLFTVVPMVGYETYDRFFPTSLARDCSVQVEIPAGPFVSGSGEKLNLGTFWIDKYEVTIGQYAQFLDWIQAHPGELGQFEHEKQPAGKTHIPPNWSRILACAKWGMRPHTGKPTPSHFNYPQFSVDYWDAYAYAKWKGRRLPTEQEWEKAARGAEGRLYPWGDQWKPNQCNSGGNKLPFLDHFSFGPVDAFPTDESPYGVVGMAGNLSEWTDSWDPSTNTPVLRGGSFAGPEQDLRERTPSAQPGFLSESIGFRTCTSEREKAP